MFNVYGYLIFTVMSEQLKKDEKLELLKKTGLIDIVEDFESLTHDQINFLLKRTNILIHLKSQQELNLILKSKEGNPLLKEKLSLEVVRRRKATQELSKYKSQLKTKLEEISNLFK